ncbi:MAG: hypothetical protein ACNI28_10325 [Arcobacter sp.]|uniref:hypothetical protein n=1 Tax=Arcobacter sp. TaxID=1872629 RepID=UPI003AFF8C15
MIVGKFKGIILQPLSSKKDTWKHFDKSKNDFLPYFQNLFTQEIGNNFYVNHNTEMFSDYLLIPYFEQKIFALYWIQAGKSIEHNEYKWEYILDKSKSQNLLKCIHIKEIIDNIEFNNDSIHKKENGSVLLYYICDNLSKETREYIEKLYF